MVESVALPVRVTPAMDEALATLARQEIEIDTSSRRRSEYSYDASNYRIRPAAIAFPRDVDDVRSVLETCRAIGLPVTSRGGGTSMAGNAIGQGIVLDFSRHMREIGEIQYDADGSASVWAGSGAVLSELRAQVEKESGGKLTFAPDPSSHTRATVGGSHANDACGNHSVAHGRMSGHVLEAEIVTAEGAHLRASAGGVQAVTAADEPSTRCAASLNEGLRALAEQNLALLRTELQTIPRQISGYHLGHLLPEQGFDVAAALSGSEGTCALLIRARVRLVPKPSATALLCVGYEDAPTAARDIMHMLAARPSAIEGLDGAIVDIVRARRGPQSVEALPEGNAYVIVEFSGPEVEDARLSCEQLGAELLALGRARDVIVETHPERRTKLWRVREDGAGLLSRRPDGTQTWPGWEDSAVAPERLGDYLEELSALIADYGYTGPMYGHFGAGCVHVRIDFDLRTDTGRDRFAAFVADAARLVVLHGGSLSGEHGDGRARSEYLPLMYSPEMIAAFRQFKRLWDPQGLLNPGIIVDPAPASESLALQDVPERTWTCRPGHTTSAPETELLPLLDPFVAGAQACIGVGRCRSNSGGFMCPSYRATRDEKDSTRGRARVLQEMVRTSHTPADGWRSSEVMEALGLCLSCKACSTDCPAGVDIAGLKSQFTNEFYRGKIRPFAHYTIGWLPRWIPVLTRISRVVNAVARWGGPRAILDRMGISAQRALPEFRPRAKWRRSRREAQFDATGDTVLFVDSFTKAFRPEVVPAAARVLRDSGAKVTCAPDACCGLTWISTGQRGAAASRMSRLIKRLDDGSTSPIVVLEPSCAAAIRDEGPKLVNDPSLRAAAGRVAQRVQSFATAVHEQQTKGWRPSVEPPDEVVVQTHCHEHAVFGEALQRDVLRHWGVDRIVESSSCCGVAGNFGFERDHYETSMRVAEHSIIPALTAASASAVVLADGFSCAMQVRQLEPDRGSRHLAQVLDPRTP